MEQGTTTPPLNFSMSENSRKNAAVGNLCKVVILAYNGCSGKISISQSINLIFNVACCMVLEV